MTLSSQIQEQCLRLEWKTLLEEFSPLVKNDIIRVNVGKFCEYQNDYVYIMLQNVDKICETTEKIVKRLHGLVDYTKNNRSCSASPTYTLKKPNIGERPERNNSSVSNFYKKFSKTPEMSQERQNIKQKQSKSTHRIDLALLKSKTSEIIKENEDDSEISVKSSFRKSSECSHSPTFANKKCNKNLLNCAQTNLPEENKKHESIQCDSKPSKNI
ncbi:unnamed protein product [Moneuplotes crassus]|uniref:Uncharacterized protein n=1 Tax=Euplotes crassus TaxID=5936 RepID=A0AAD1X5G8_EUPCR|nr:unnamed protein product [Moneuplotes crassus]